MDLKNKNVNFSKCKILADISSFCNTNKELLFDALINLVSLNSEQFIGSSNMINIMMC